MLEASRGHPPDGVRGRAGEAVRCAELALQAMQAVAGRTHPIMQSFWEALAKIKDAVRRRSPTSSHVMRVRARVFLLARVDLLGRAGKATWCARHSRLFQSGSAELPEHAGQVQGCGALLPALHSAM